jgi:hypothetical protein
MGSRGESVGVAVLTGAVDGVAGAAEAADRSSAGGVPADDPTVGTLDVGAATGETSPGSTRRPRPDASRAVANPQSSRRVACSSSCTGRRSACIRLTTSRRPSRSAAATNVCRAASVNPVLPASVPG